MVVVFLVDILRSKLVSFLEAQGFKDSYFNLLVLQNAHLASPDGIAGATDTSVVSDL